MSRNPQFVDSRMKTSLRLVKTEEAAFNALAEISLEIMAERDKTERQIKALLESGEDRKALRLMRKHFGIAELKVVQK